jgi:3-hydroxybutyryl-CoA dehydrogenase
MSMQKVGVIGAGLMGNGIAQACAVAGLQVVMVDVNDAAIQRGTSTVAGSLDRLVKKEKLSAADKDAALARIAGTTQYSALKGVDLLIEAATENLELKLRILKQVDDLLDQSTIIATNTSSISITQLAAVVSKPERFIGIHFFNPVPVMALVELIRGLQTGDATLAQAEAFVKAIGKTPITVKNSPGFVVNRILCPMINEAIFTLQEGLASAQQIDDGMRLGCNHPIGPLALADLVGLDVCLSVLDVLHRDFRDSKYRACPLLRDLVAAGRHGRKSLHGVYRYD